MKLRARMVSGAIIAALAVGFAPSVLLLAPPAGLAQNLGQRVVSGSVLNADAQALPGATVFLRNAKTKSIRSYTSTKDGRFRFAQVNMSDDYDLWAEKDGKKTAIKTVSSWDTRKELETELRMK